MTVSTGGTPPRYAPLDDGVDRRNQASTQASIKETTNSNLREHVKQVLKAHISTGELVPGVLYSVAQYSSSLGVSSTPVREAVLELAYAGLVEIHRNRGFTIPRLTDAQLDELYEIRLLLEVPTMVAVAGRLDGRTLAECQLQAENSRECAEGGDLVGFLEADRVLHGLLLSAYGNDRLVSLVGRLRDEARLPGLPALVQTGALVTAAEEHILLLAAVASGEKERTRTVITKHLRHTRGLWAGRAEPSEETRKVR